MSDKIWIDYDNYYEVDTYRWQIKEGSHYYRSARLVSNDSRPLLRSNSSEDAKYICVYDGALREDDPDILDWRATMNWLIKHKQLPMRILRPRSFCAMFDTNACYLAPLPFDVADDNKIKKELVGDGCLLLLELYAKGLMDATAANLKPYNIFVSKSEYSVLVDTMPGIRYRNAPWQNMKSFLQYFEHDLDPKYNWWQMMTSPRDIFNLSSCLVDAHYQTSSGGREPECVNLEIIVESPRSILGSGSTNQNVDKYPLNREINLNDLHKILPNQPLFRTFRHSDGRLMMYNTSRYDWVSCRYSGTKIRSGMAFAPRVKESISFSLLNGKRITMTIQGFTKSASTVAPPVVARHASKQQANNASTQRPTPNQSTRTANLASNPVTRTASPALTREAPPKAPMAKETVLPKPVQLAVKVEAKPLSDQYDYDAAKLPPLNHVIPAKEKATGHRVMLEHLSDSPAGLYDGFMELRKRPPKHVEGLCNLVNVRKDKSISGFILVREAPMSEGWYPANHPALRKLSWEELFTAAEDMMRLLNGVLAQHWVPTRFIETHMLVDPRTLKARFLDGAWLSREGRVPLECTLGYRAPETYAPEHRASASDINFCAAVWLYRLLVGGYPMEGRQTREMLAKADRASEAEMAFQLYGENAIFVFDPDDRRNAIDGLGGAFDEQCGRWHDMPEALRDGWRTTFSACLHKDIFGRVTPARWAELLRGELQKGGR